VLQRGRPARLLRPALSYSRPLAPGSRCFRNVDRAPVSVFPALPDNPPGRCDAQSSVRPEACRRARSISGERTGNPRKP
jgi:hypothetical protein